MTSIDNELLGKVSSAISDLREINGTGMGEPLSEEMLAQLAELDRTDPIALTGERKNTHGDWMRQSSVAQELKTVVGSNGGHLEPHQREAVDMICVKISRILSGDPNHADHWDDIAGYAHLGKGGHK